MRVLPLSPAAGPRRRPAGRLLPWCWLLLLLVPLGARAQQVRWEPPGGSLALRQTSQLSLIFENCEPTDAFTLPSVPHLTIGQPSRGEQSSFSVVNRQATRTKTVYFTYPVRPDSRTPIHIPSFTVQTDKGAVQVPAADFTVGDATVGNSSVPLDSAANSRVTVGGGQLWAGEVVPVTYVLSVANRYPASYASGPEWDPTPLVIEEWSKPEPGTALVNGETRNTVTYRTRGYVRTPGTYTLEPMAQLVNLRVPGSGFSIFQAFQAEQYTITSNAPQLVVRPLPSPAARGFNGAVGDFRLTSQVVPAQATVGEPVTWTLTLTGTGNWPDFPGLPARDVSRDFRVVQPQAQRTPEEGRLFDATLSEDVVLIPTKPGSYRLGPVVWSYFDPKAGRYRTITTEPTTVEVTAPAAPSPDPGAAAGADADQADAPPAEAPLVRATPAPSAPPSIPRDPLPSAGAAPVPWPARTLTWSALALLGIVPIVWLGLATQRARQRDPGRAARVARERLRQTVRALATDPDPARRRALLARWQRDAIILWNVPRAAPSAAVFERDAAWRQLWLEAERALYGPDATLPSDWPARARQALERRRAPRFPLRSVFRAQNLVPLIAIGLVLASGASSRADPAQQAYESGDFRTAEQQWRQRLERQPTDWVAHHNLALALAQQQRWGEAAAHALVAFVQHPADPSVRWHLTYTLGRAGYAPAILGEFAEPGLLDRVAWQLSPAGWQRVLLLAAGLVALALLVLLLRVYGHAARWAGRAAVGLLVVALAFAITAALSLPRYGPAADARAVVFWRATPLRSLPTDVAAEQQATTLAAGTIAQVDKEFLGWRRVAFPNGQTGWVRAGEYLPFWR